MIIIRTDTTVPSIFVGSDFWDTLWGFCKLLERLLLLGVIGIIYYSSS